VRYLIINADDYGVCMETNKAIEHIFNEGTISSTTIMTPCIGAEDGVTRAKANPKIKMGLHITTNAEWTKEYGSWKPVAPAEQTQSLTDENGYFFNNVAAFASQAKGAEVAVEIEAQYQFLLSRGIAPTHADSHMGSVYGLSGVSFMKETLEFCAKHSLPFRFPKNIENVKMLTRLETIPAPLAAAHQQAVGYASMLGVKLIDNLLSCLLDYSELTSYEKVRDEYFRILSHLPEGVSELFLHPSAENSPMGKNNPKWQSRVWEYQLLLDDAFKRHIESENITLISYPQIP